MTTPHTLSVTQTSLPPEAAASPTVPIWNLASGNLAPGLYAVLLPKAGDLRVKDLDGSVVASIPGVRDEAPAISPDGSKIAYRGPSSVSLEILDLRDMSVRTLGQGSDLHFGPPSWSPDGEMLVFDGEPRAPSIEPVRLSLYKISVETGEIRQLTQSDGVVEAGPVWSPDGAAIAFVSSRRSGEPGKNDLYLYDVSCMEEAERCAERANWIPLPGYEGFVGGVTWSPDATALALECVGEKGWNLCVYHKDTGKLLDLPRGQGDVRFPHWSPDGAWILVTEERALSPSSVVHAIRTDWSETRRISGDESEIGVGWLLVR